MRLAQRDVSLGALTRAYNIGQSMLLRRALDEVERLEISNEGAKMAVVRGVADVVHRYIDWILKYVTEVYEVERRRWWTSRATTNAAAVMRVLRRIAVVLGSTKPPLVTAVDGSMARAWVAVPSLVIDPARRRQLGEMAESREGAGIKFAIGSPDAGLDGFRRSYEQASLVRLVGLGAANG